MTRSFALPHTGKGLADKALSASLWISVLSRHNLQERRGPGGHCQLRTVDHVMAPRPTVWLGIWWGPPYGSPDTLGQPPLSLQLSTRFPAPRPVGARSDGIVSGCLCLQTSHCPLRASCLVKSITVHVHSSKHKAIQSSRAAISPSESVSPGAKVLA